MFHAGMYENAHSGKLHPQTYGYDSAQYTWASLITTETVSNLNTLQ